MRVFYFTASWCQPCKTFGPVMEKLAKDYDVTKIDIEQDMDSTAFFGVMSVPTVVAVAEDRELARFVGARPYDWVVDFLKETEH